MWIVFEEPRIANISSFTISQFNFFLQIRSSFSTLLTVPICYSLQLDEPSPGPSLLTLKFFIWFSFYFNNWFLACNFRTRRCPWAIRCATRMDQSCTTERISLGVLYWLSFPSNRSVYWHNKDSVSNSLKPCQCLQQTIWSSAIKRTCFTHQ